MIKKEKISNVFNFSNMISLCGIYTTKLISCLSFFSIAYLFLIKNYPLSLDAPLPWQMSFQQSASPTMEAIVDLHHNIMFFMIYIVIFVSYILLRAIFLFNSSKRTPFDSVSRTRHYLSIEIIWTILPLLILFWIALPSFALLYSMDHCPKIDLTIKVIGRQWYWTYEIDTFLRYRMKNPNYTDFKQTGLIYEMINHIIILLFKNKLFFHGSSDLILTKNITSPNNIFFFILSKLLSNNYDVSCINTNKIIEAYVNSFRNVHSLGNVLHADSLEENKDLSWLRAFVVPPCITLEERIEANRYYVDRFKEDFAKYNIVLIEDEAAQGKRQKVIEAFEASLKSEVAPSNPDTSSTPDISNNPIVDNADQVNTSSVDKSTQTTSLSADLNDGTKSSVDSESKVIDDSKDVSKKKPAHMTSKRTGIDHTILKEPLAEKTEFTESEVRGIVMPENVLIDVMFGGYTEAFEYAKNNCRAQAIWHIPNPVKSTVRQIVTAEWHIRNVRRANYWIVGNIVENFDGVISDNQFGYTSWSNDSFLNVVFNVFYDVVAGVYRKNHAVGYDTFFLIDYTLFNLFENDFDSQLNWILQRKNIFRLFALNEDKLTWIRAFLKNERIPKSIGVKALIEYFHYNRSDYILRDILLLDNLNSLLTFKHSSLLKNFFFSLVTGEFYTFKNDLEKKNLSLFEFVKSFSDWYIQLYKHISMLNVRVNNSLVFLPLILELSENNSEWLKKNKYLFFPQCPSPFIKYFNNYKNSPSIDFLNFCTNAWVLDHPIKVLNYIIGNMCRLEPFLGLLARGINISVFDVEVFKNNKYLANSVMNINALPSFKVFLFYHSLLQKDILTQYNIKKNKFYHYLVEFDSCIVSDNEVYGNYLKILKNEKILNLETLPTSFCGWWRLLEVDNRLILPIKTRLRVLVTSSDVLHSWAVPSLGVKIDACPGRLNCIYVYIKRPGIFHGQCSELCGVKHGFMPIVVHAVTKDKYNRWFADNCEFVS